MVWSTYFGSCRLLYNLYIPHILTQICVSSLCLNSYCVCRPGLEIILLEINVQMLGNIFSIFAVRIKPIRSHNCCGLTSSFFLNFEKQILMRQVSSSCLQFLFFPSPLSLLQNSGATFFLSTNIHWKPQCRTNSRLYRNKYA